MIEGKAVDRNANIRKWTDAAYIVCLAVFLVNRVFRNTMIAKDFGIKRFKQGEMILLLITLVLVFIKIVYLRCYTLYELVIAVLFCAASFLAWMHARTYWFTMLPLLMVGAKGVPFDKIVKTFLIAVGSMIGLSMILALTNVITNLRYVRLVTDPSMPNGVREVYRYAFGTTYPTTFSEFVFFLSAGWLFIRRHRLKIYDTVVFVVLAIFLYKGSDAKTDAMCLIGLTVVVVFALIFRKVSPRVQSVLHKLCAPFIFLMCLCAIIMTALMIGYDESKPFWNVLDTRLHLRLSLGHTGLERYGINLFGAKVKYKATGGDVSKVSRTDYFNLDCSYHLILINFGIIVMIFVIGLFTLAAYRAWKEKDLVLLLIIAVISVECVMENRLIQLQYNIFLLMFFADIQSADGSLYCILNRPLNRAGKSLSG